MNWNDLQYFLSVARAGQIERAAPKMQVDPTTVSRRLRRLEKDLGQRLFVQVPSGQRLTEAGKQLLKRAELMEDTADGIGLVAPDTLKEPTGVVRLSASEGFGTWIIAPHLPEFHRCFPKVQVELVATTGFLSPSRRETDVAILLARPRRGPLITRKLTDYSLGMYASEEYLEKESPTSAELDRYTHIGYVDDLIYAPELRYLDQIAPGLEPKLRSTSINAQYRLCVAGGGIAILPHFIGSADRRLKRILPEKEITRSFWIVTHRQVRQVEQVGLIIDWLTELVRKLQPQLVADQ